MGLLKKKQHFFVNISTYRALSNNCNSFKLIIEKQTVFTHWTATEKATEKKSVSGTSLLKNNSVSLMVKRKFAAETYLF